METKVFIAACPDYSEEAVQKSVERIFDHYGGAQAFLRYGSKVAIKPNLLMPRSPDGVTTTHPEVVACVAKLFVNAGAQVSIVESSGGPYNDLVLNLLYKRCGMEKAAERSGAALNHDCSSKTVRAVSGERDFDILTPLLEADVIINIAKLKTHQLTYFTGACKNLFGAVPGLKKALYHRSLPDKYAFGEMLTDLCETVAPTFNIIDGVDGMEGMGPSGGRKRHAGLLIASENPYAADLAGMHICGLDPQKAVTHVSAVDKGLVTQQAAELDWCGDGFTPLTPPFLEPAKAKATYTLISWLPKPLRRRMHKLLSPKPRITSRCTGCGVCAQSCPQEIIKISEGKAHIDLRKCIVCYCCHELCPVKAIDLK